MGGEADEKERSRIAGGCTKENWASDLGSLFSVLGATHNASDTRYFNVATGLGCCAPQTHLWCRSTRAVVCSRSMVSTSCGAKAAGAC